MNVCEFRHLLGMGQFIAELPFDIPLSTVALLQLDPVAFFCGRNEFFGL